MTASLKVALAQANFLVGDVGGNADRVIALASRAAQAGADVVAFPELSLAGYPPEDLLFHRGFRRQIDAALERVRAASGSTAILVGHPEYTASGIFNSATWYAGGEEQVRHRKSCLPNYRVFDEKRYFLAGAQATVIEYRGFSIGVLVCEDIWEPGPAQLAKAQGAELLLVLNASPFELHKQAQRERVVRERIADVRLPEIGRAHV